MTAARRRGTDLRRTLQSAALIGLLAMVIAVPLLEQVAPAAASLYRRAGYATIGAVALLGLWPFANWRRLLVVPWPLVGALAWCWLSLTWSASPGEALTRLVITSLVIWIAFATVRHLGYDRALATIRFVLAAALLVNYMSIVAIPDIAIEYGQFQWSLFQWVGLMGHKNFAGALCAFTALIFVFDVEQRWRAPFLCIAAAAALFCILTVSRTAMIAGAAGLLAGTILLAFQRQLGASLKGTSARSWRILCYGLAALFLGAVLFFTFDNDAFLTLIANPDALSRRTVIWRQLVQSYATQPWSGVGFGSYWTAVDQTSILRRGPGMTEIEQGHNGFLDILLQVGIPGLTLVLFAVVMWPARFVARQIVFAPASAALVTALLTLCLGANLTESGFLERDSLWSVLLILTLALISGLAQRLQLTRTPWLSSEERRGAAARTKPPRRRASTASSLPASSPQRHHRRQSSAPVIE